MSREWKPGDAVAFTIGGQEYRGIIDTDGRPYTTDKRASGRPARSTSIRPLVVIDPDDREQVERLARLCSSVPAEMALSATRLDAMQAALREFANPTPPKPDEPTGLGAVVEDADGQRWVRVRSGFDWRWRDDRLGEQTTWEHVPAVTVLFEGVTP